jgi:hypothetical protein
MAKNTLYRVSFHNRGKIYEIYCAEVSTSALWGFLEVRGMVFEAEDTLVVDPAEERIREEFEDVEVLHVPLHGVLRVEQVRRKGQSAIRERESGEKVTPFPLTPPGRSTPS